jgi:hypothetical protein
MLVGNALFGTEDLAHFPEREEHALEEFLRGIEDAEGVLESAEAKTGYALAALSELERRAASLLRTADRGPTVDVPFHDRPIDVGDLFRRFAVVARHFADSCGPPE